MTAINIGICGVGTVGGATLQRLQLEADLLAARCGGQLRVVHLGCRNPTEELLAGPWRVSRDVLDVAKDPDVHILVETIGGTDTALTLLTEALTRGKHVVTANKALIAEHGNALAALAARHNAGLCFEAAVAGGIPIIKALREGLAANRIDWLAGIINGTGNYILTQMQQAGREFDDVLAEAQALGYAEADPSFDIEGTDAAHKLVILAALAFGMPFSFDKVYTEGITALTPEDLQNAVELGYRIKHLGIARQAEQGIELRVHPTLIPEQRLLAKVDGVMNAVLLHGDAVGPTLYYGAGAGADATASAVLADVVDLARDLACGQLPRLPVFGVEGDAIAERPIVPMAQIEAAYYLRLQAADRPGVMAAVTRLLGEQGISIEALIQRPPLDAAAPASVVILTSLIPEANLLRAVTAIEALEDTRGDVIWLRVENLDG